MSTSSSADHHVADVVVGGGSAGAVIAARLSRDPSGWTVSPATWRRTTQMQESSTRSSSGKATCADTGDLASAPLTPGLERLELEWT
jgi:hypothetical protein